MKIIMELRQLRYFVEVARLKSYSLASKSLFITQSTISQQIQKLEEELDVELLIRDTRHVALSDYGEQFYDYAIKVLKDAQAGIDRIRDVRNLQVGTLSIGATHSFAPLLRQTIMDFNRLYPGIRLNIVSISKEVLHQQLIDRDLDLALSYRSSIIDERIESHLLFSSRLCLVARKGVLVKVPDKIHITDLSKYPLTLPAKGLQARDTLETIMFGSDIKLDIRLEMNSIHSILDFVANSSTMTLISSEAVHDRNSFDVVPIDHPDSKMDGCYHFLKGSYHKTSAVRFIDLLTENNSFNQNIDKIINS